MSMNGNYPPSFRAAKLYRKSSKSGGSYFTGRWGGAKVALVKTQETGDGGDEIWALLLSEAPAYKGEDKPAAPAPSSAPARYIPQTLDDDAIPAATSVSQSDVTNSEPTKPPMTNATKVTYRYRDADKWRAYMRDLMRKKRANSVT